MEVTGYRPNPACQLGRLGSGSDGSVKFRRIRLVSPREASFLLDKLSQAGIWGDSLGAMSHIKLSQGASNGRILPYPPGSPVLLVVFPDSNRSASLDLDWQGLDVVSKSKPI